MAIHEVNGHRSRRAPTTPMPRERKTYYVYLMGSLSGTLYVGMTSKLHARTFEHKFHRVEGFTDKYRVERLLYWESFDEVHNAINREKQLKGWRRSKKIALIESLNPQWLDLARDWFPWIAGSCEGRGPSTPQADSHSRIHLLRSG